MKMAGLRKFYCKTASPNFHSIANIKCIISRFLNDRRSQIHRKVAKSVILFYGQRLEQSALSPKVVLV